MNAPQHGDDPADDRDVRDYFEDLRQSGEGRRLAEESRRRHLAQGAVAVVVLTAIGLAIKILRWVLTH